MSGLFIAIDAVVMFLGIMCGFWTNELLDMLMSVIAAPRFGYRLCYVNIFGVVFARNCDNKWVKSRGRFSVKLHHRNSIADLSVPVSRKSEIIFMLLRSAIFIAAAAVISLLSINSIKKSALFFVSGSAPIPDVFLTAFSFGLVLSTLLFIITFVRALKTDSFSAYIKSLTDRMIAGVPFSELDMKPVDELPCKDSNNMQRDAYNSLYMMYLISEGYTDKLAAPAHELTDHLLRKDAVASPSAFYHLIFYYSRYELNPSLAKTFLDKVGTVIAADTDANAKRVLAYYAYCIEGDRQKARFFIDEAAASVDIFSTGSERELERRLIKILDETLTEEGY